MTGMFKDLDLAMIQQKVLENPKASLGAAAVSLVAITYVLTRSSRDNADDDEEFGLPEYARTDMDLAFTQRFAKNKNRYAHRNRRRLKTSKPSSTDDAIEEHKDSENDNVHNYSTFDPMNPSYIYNDAESDEDYESEPDEGFSVDQYYVPFRVNKARTKRKPDAPFMAMFSMYASKRNTAEMPPDDEQRNGHHLEPMSPMLDGVEETEDEEDIGGELKLQNGGTEMMNGHQEAERDAEEKLENDRGTSPPLSPMIPSNHISVVTGNPLENLKERYYKQQLPPSLQPTEQEMAMSSTNPNGVNGHESPQMTTSSAI